MASPQDDDISAIQIIERSRRRRALGVFAIVLLLAAVLYVGVHFLPLNAPVTYQNDEEHFKYGSIGSEAESGLPYILWKALPSLYPEVFKGQDYSVFGFLYENDADGRRRDLPIGLSRRVQYGVDTVWLNCAVCHAGTVRDTEAGPVKIVAGMPSNNLDFHRFIKFVIGMAGDPRLNADTLIPAMEKAGARLDWIDRLAWRLYIVPTLQSTLKTKHDQLEDLIDKQPQWGPGRVDTFNTYKVQNFGTPYDKLAKEENVGTADFPSIFNQKPREGMHLHWDGNNDSLAERNLSAAIGAGVTEKSVDHPSVERVAAWLQNLRPLPNPNHPDAAKVSQGRTIYMAQCAACHGWQDSPDYVFKGDYVGKVEPIAKVMTDPARLNSYTEAFRDQQLKLFAGSQYQFTHFMKTDGYANMPLDGLWLRAPYLHDGSVPTLADLLTAPGNRPKAFVRGLDVIDPAKGGFVAPSCVPGQPLERGFCYDTGATGNGNGGHGYGVGLTADEKTALLAYLLTF